jgi:hypothetical protein
MSAQQRAIALATVGRPRPPKELTDHEAEIWKWIVDRLPPDWFPSETHPLLVQYCRHVLIARHLWELIEDYKADGQPIYRADYNRLLSMHERETKAIAILATRMRLTQHSLYDKTKKKPWEVSG